MSERLGIAGAGAIACGLAACAARHGEVVLWARSDSSAQRAEETVHKVCGRLSGEVNAAHVQVSTDLGRLGDGTTFLVEAIAEDLDLKRRLLGELTVVAGDDTVLATTTSSLSVQRLAEATGVPERFVALHVFNPVPRMKLIELAYPQQATPQTRERARVWGVACAG